MCFRKYKFSGVTLIELLISLTLSLFILDALFSIYLTCKKNFLLQSHLSDIQENAQTALQTLKTDIEAAGYIGCARLAENFPLQNHTSYLFNANNIAVGAPHQMTVRHMQPCVSGLAQPMRDFISFKVSGPRTYTPKQIMILSDCQSADIFYVKNVRRLDKNLQLITASTPLSKNYDTNAETAELVENTYFVKNTGRRSREGQPIYALFMRNINAHNVEIVENIDALSFAYAPQGIAIHLIAGEGALNKDWYAYVQTMS